MSAAPPPARRPWWWVFFFFVRSPADATAYEWRILGLLGLTFLLNQYDFALLGLALPQIQAGLGLAEEDVGASLALVRLGVVPAVALALLADRVGRRRILLFCISGFALATGATALAPDPRSFVALQFLARMFMAAEELVAIVFITEEVAARSRGWALGILGGFGALGHGAASLAFGFIEQLPAGWRALYAIGVLPLLLLAWVRRGIPETRRFESERERRTLRSAWQPARELLSRHRGRALVFSAALVPFAFVVIPALSFVSKTLQEVHGYSPPQITALFIGAGVLVFAANAVGGRLSDRFGRRRVLTTALLLNAVAIAVFYRASGPLLVPIWVIMMASFVAADVLFGAVGGELFPTGSRSTASGLRGLMIAVAGALGLAFEGWLYTRTGAHTQALGSMALLAVMAPLVVLAAFPETAGRELEEITPEAGPIA